MKSMFSKTKLFPIFMFITLVISMLITTPGLANTTDNPWFVTTWGGYGSIYDPVNYPPDDGKFSSAYAVDALKVDAQNTLVFVADTGNLRVQIFRVVWHNLVSDPKPYTYDVSFLTKIETFGAGDTFGDPRGIAVDSTGNLYVSDNTRILKFTVSGTFPTYTYTYDSKITGLCPNAHGLAVDSTGGFVYVACTNNDVPYGIRKITKDKDGTGSLTHVAWLPAKSPTDVALDKNNAYLYVAESLKGDDPTKFLAKRINLSTSAVISVGFSTPPEGVTTDSAGLVYITLPLETKKVQKWTEDFASTVDFPSSNKDDPKWNPISGTGNGQYTSPRGIAALDEDVLFVTDIGSGTTNQRVTFYERNVAPEDISISGTSIGENDPDSTPIGDLAFTDANLSDTGTFSLSTAVTAPLQNQDGTKTDVTCDPLQSAAFKVVYTSSKYQLQNTTMLDADTQADYYVCIEAKDRDLNTYTEAFHITVTNGFNGPYNVSRWNGTRNSVQTRFNEYFAANENCAAADFPKNDQFLYDEIIIRDNDINAYLDVTILTIADIPASNPLYSKVHGKVDFKGALDLVLDTEKSPPPDSGTNNDKYLYFQVKNQSELDYDKYPSNWDTKVPSGYLVANFDDRTGLSSTYAFEIYLNPINECPVMIQPTQTMSVNELSNSGVQVTNGEIYVDDADRPMQNLTLYEDPAHENPWFAIEKSTEDNRKYLIKVQQGNKIDYEQPPSHVSSMYFYIHDLYGPSYPSAPNLPYKVDINILNVNELPTWPNVETPTYEIGEDAPVGYKVDLVTDPDGDQVKYTIYDYERADQAGTFEVSPTGDLLVKDNTWLSLSKYPSLADAYIKLMMTVKDYTGVESNPKWVKLNIVPKNWLPVITPDQAVTIKENSEKPLMRNTAAGSIVSYITATDNENEAMEFATDSTGPFTVETDAGTPGRGIIKVKMGPGTDPDFYARQIDYEALGADKTINLPIKVRDAGMGASDWVTGNFPIHVTNQNEAVTLNQPADVSIGDNTNNGTTIATVTSTDLDETPNPRNEEYFLSVDLPDGSQNPFAIDKSTGVITVKDNSLLHFYLKPTYILNVIVNDKTDAGSDDAITSDPKSFKVTLQDENDPPTFLPASLSVYEHTPGTTPDTQLVGKFTVFDENDNNFSLTLDTDVSGTAYFDPPICTPAPGTVSVTVNNITYQKDLQKVCVVEVRVKTSDLFNYEKVAGHSLPLKINATDGTETSTKTYDVSLINVNERPVFDDQTIDIYEHAAGYVGSLAAIDEDEGTVLTYVKLDRTAGDSGWDLFDVSSTGDITVKTGMKDYIAIGPDLVIHVRVTDNNIPNPQPDPNDADADPGPLSKEAAVTIHVTPQANPTLLTFNTLPASPILSGTRMSYKVVAKNEGAGKTVAPYGTNPGDFTLKITLPGEVEFETTGSTKGCFKKTAATVECPGVSLAPKGETGDSFEYTINGFLSTMATSGKALTTTAELMPNTVNDTDPSEISNLSRFTFTVNKNITVTDQSFGGTLDSLYLNNVLSTYTPLNTSNLTTTCNASARQFLGLFKNDRVAFKQENVKAHEQVEISFDLYLAYGWDGVNADKALGPDRWKLCIGNGNCQEPTDAGMLLDTTFSNMPEDASKQSYPNWYGVGETYNAFTKAAERFTLGYTDAGPCTPGGASRDSVYHLKYKFDHTDPTLIINFIGQAVLDGGANPEQWGIDNLKVTIIGRDALQFFMPDRKSVV